MKNLLFILLVLLVACKKKPIVPTNETPVSVCENEGGKLNGRYNPHQNCPIPIVVTVKYYKSNCPTDNRSIYLFYDLKDFLNQFLIKGAKKYTNPVDTFYINNLLTIGNNTDVGPITIKIKRSPLEDVITINGNTTIPLDLIIKR